MTLFPVCSSIVESIQRHKSIKKGTICRFSFPHPPSSRPLSKEQATVNVEPNDMAQECGEDGAVNQNNACDDTNKQNAQCMKMELAEKILERVWKVFIDTSQTFASADSLFDAIGISQELFEEAYKRISKKMRVVLKRRPCDVWVNHYSRDLLLCWNTNMSI